MRDFIFHIIVSIALLNWCLYILVILPKVRQNRTIYLSDWGFGIGKPFKALFEYKELCERDNEPVFWFKVQVSLIIAFVVFILLVVFVV